jgi:transglutaminase-like putative cysteine protease
MRYQVGLEIGYDYDGPSDAARHVLRLAPATITDRQTLISWTLEVSPRPAERHGRIDFFGNVVTDVTLRTVHRRLRYKMKAVVDRQSIAGVLDISPSLPRLAEEVAAFKGLTSDSPHHFLGATPRTGPMPETTRYARSAAEGALTTFEAVEAIGRALHRDMTFDADATTVETSPGEAFADRRGVCQDFTHVMIACLRGIGVPAGYVSGFLRTKPPEGESRLEGADAMHAWVRAWCGYETGWVEYDPTNALLVSGDHIVVAHGRDYGDVAPVKGMTLTAGSQTSRHSVDVIPLDET